MSNGANVKCNHSTLPTHRQGSNVGMSNSAIIAVERPFKLRALIRSAEIIKGGLSSIIETFILNVSSCQCASCSPNETSLTRTFTHLKNNRPRSRSAKLVGCRIRAQDHHHSVFSPKKCQWTWVKGCNIISSPRARQKMLMLTSRSRLQEGRHWQGSPDKQLRVIFSLT